jgi:hypothetical protein
MRIPVPSPLGPVPDLEAIRDADYSDLTSQIGVVPQRARQDETPLGIELNSVGVAEEHPGVRSVGGLRDGEGLHLLLPTLPLKPRKCEQAAVLPERQVDAVLECASELRGERDATLGIDLVVMLAEELRHVGALPPPLCPTFMPPGLHQVKILRRITVM